MNSIQSPYKRQILYRIASNKPHNSKAVGANVKEGCICQREHLVWGKGRSKPTSDVGDVESTPITNKRPDVPLADSVSQPVCEATDGPRRIVE
jgi:hypothetical protein